MYNLEDFQECKICHDPKHLCTTGDSTNQRQNPHNFEPGGDWYIMSGLIFQELAEQYRAVLNEHDYHV